MGLSQKLLIKRMAQPRVVFYSCELNGVHFNRVVFVYTRKTEAFRLRFWQGQKDLNPRPMVLE